MEINKVISKRKDTFSKIGSVLIFISILLSTTSLLVMPVSAVQNDAGSGGDAGDSFSSSTELSGPGDYTAELNSTDQDDYYNITLNKDHVYWLNASADQNINFYIYDSSGSEMDSSYGYSKITFSQAIKETTYYYLRVENDYSGYNSYHLNVTDWISQDDAGSGGDAGNGFSSATTLNSTGDYTGFFEYDGDRYDYYSMELNADYVYWFNGSADKEMGLSVYDSSQNELDAYSGSTSSILNLAIQQNDTYYIEIYINTDSQSDYDLNITEAFKQDDANTSHDAGDDFSTATPLNSTGDYKGFFEYDGDRYDYYSIDLTGDHVYWFNGTAGKEMGLSVYDSSQSEIDGYSGSTSASLCTALPANDTYYIEMYINTDSHEHYDLNITQWFKQDDANTSHDAGDDFSTATPLNSTGDYKGFFEYDGDRYDYYSIDLTGDYVYWFNGSTSNDIGLKIYDSSQNELDGYSGSSSVSLCTALSENGTYYIEMYLYSGGYGDYDLNITKSFSQNDANTGHDAGNDFSTATPLNSTGDYTGYFEYDGDRYDYYSIDLTGDYVYWFNGSASNDIGLKIHDSSQNKLDGYSGNPAYNICLSIQENGTYYIEMYLYSGGYGDYDLNITKSFSQNDANTGHDAGDDFSTATPLNSTGDYTGYFEYDGDKYDYYSIELSGDYVYWFNGSADDDIGLKIYDSSQNKLDGYSGNPSYNICLAIQQNDTYYIEMYLYSGGYGYYDLNITEWLKQDDVNTGHDAGNDFSTATPLGSTGDYNGFFEYDGDRHDYYSIELNEDFVYWFNGSADDDIGLEIYDASQTKLDSYTGSPTSNICLAIQQNGTYYIDMYLYSGGYGYYDLNVTGFKQDDAGSGHDAAGNFSTNIKLTTGEWHGFLEEDGDENDYYKMDFAKGETMYINLTGPNVNNELGLYNTSRVEKAYSDSSYYSFESILWEFNETGTWYIRVRDYADTGTYTLAINDANNSFPNAPTNPSPADGAEDVSLNSTLSVDVSDPDGDAMTVTFYDAYDDTVIGQNTGVTNGTTSVTWNDLSTGTTYDWYVVADDGTFSEQSSTWSFTTLNNPPSAPTNPSPVDGAENVSLNPSLEVDVSDPDGDAMTVTFYDSSDNTAIGQNTGVTNGTTSVTWNDLSTGTTYSWYVIADDGTNSTQSSSWSFTTLNNAPAAPNDPSPADGAENVSLNPNLEVNVSDPDGDAMTVTFYDTSDDTLIGQNTGVTNGTTSVTWNDLSTATTYSWYVIADDGTNSTQSSTWSFTTRNSAPDSPTAPSPADGAIDVSTNPTLSVNVSDPNGDTMTVTFYDASDDSMIGQNTGITNGTTSVTWNDLSTGTTYDWYAVANDGAASTQSSTWSFTTMNTAPDAPTDPSPADGAENVSLSPTLSVNVSDPDGDAMTVTFYDASDNTEIGQNTGVTNGTTSVTWSSLSTRTTYSWYAVAEDSTASTQSSSWSFTTLNNAPAAPTSPSPADGAVNVSLNPSLEVDVSDPDGDTMTVTFYDASDDTVIGQNSGVTSGTTSTTWNDLSTATSYSWYVVADDGTNSTQSSTWSFTTRNKAPSAPTNPSPGDGATDVSTSPTLSVEVSDPDGDTMTVTFYDASDNSQIAQNTGVTNGTTSVTWSGLSYSTTYNWYAVADDGQASTQSSTWSFTTQAEPNSAPAAPTNPVPADGATDVGTSPTLSVDVSDPEGDTMSVMFYDASDDSQIGQNTGVTNGTTSVTWSGLSYDTTYNWYVVADDAQASTQSSTWSFTTMAEPNSAPAAPTNPSPDDGATEVSTNPTLSVDVSDPDGDSMTVTFYNASDDSEIGTVTGVDSGSTASITWSGLSEGTTYEWYAVADDGTNSTQSSIWSFTTQAENQGQGPVADIYVEDTSIEPGEEVTFDAAPSSGNVVNYTWSVDGEKHYGEVCNYTFEEEGDYTVELTVIDGAGNMDTDTVEITVEKGSSDADEVGWLPYVVLIVAVIAVITAVIYWNTKE